MRDFHHASGKRHKYHAANRPNQYPNHSALASPTVELVHVSPDKFCWLERPGKRRKKRITLPHVSILD